MLGEKATIFGTGLCCFVVLLFLHNKGLAVKPFPSLKGLAVKLASFAHLLHNAIANGFTTMGPLDVEDEMTINTVAPNKTNSMEAPLSAVAMVWYFQCILTERAGHPSLQGRDAGIQPSGIPAGHPSL